MAEQQYSIETVQRITQVCVLANFLKVSTRVGPVPEDERAGLDEKQMKELDEVVMRLAYAGDTVNVKRGQLEVAVGLLEFLAYCLNRIDIMTITIAKSSMIELPNALFTTEHVRAAMGVGELAARFGMETELTDEPLAEDGVLKELRVVIRHHGRNQQISLPASELQLIAQILDVVYRENKKTIVEL